MQTPLIITQDVITHRAAPLGFITGFPRTQVSSTWRDKIGKLLTDKRISYYQKHGYYGKNGILVITRLDAQERKQQLIQRYKNQRIKLSLEKLMKLFI